MLIHFAFFSLRIPRWNDDDDQDTNDRKTDLGAQSISQEEYNRKRKSRWNGKRRALNFMMIGMIFLESSIKQEPMEHQFVQQIHEGQPDG